MKRFSTVKQACNFLELSTQKRWASKYEILHGKRFYFIWRADSLPFDQQQWTLVCRGDKETVLRKLEAFVAS